MDDGATVSKASQNKPRKIQPKKTDNLRKMQALAVHSLLCLLAKNDRVNNLRF